MNTSPQVTGHATVTQQPQQAPPEQYLTATATAKRLRVQYRIIRQLIAAGLVQLHDGISWTPMIHCDDLPRIRELIAAGMHRKSERARAAAPANLLTLPQVADKAGATSQTVQRMIASGRLPTTRIKGHRGHLIAASDVQIVVDQMERYRRRCIEITDPTPEQIRDRCAEIRRLRARADRPSTSQGRHGAVLALLRKRPGLSINEVADALQLNTDTAKRHLERLEESKSIELVANNPKRWAIPGTDFEYGMQSADSILADMRSRAKAHVRRRRQQPQRQLAAAA